MYVQNLRSVAPLWILIQHFDCRELLPLQRLVPVASLLDMYIAKQLSRSTLVAGLDSNTSTQLGQMVFIPAPFFRPLEYVLELIETSPSLYKPISPGDLSAGLPSANWCLPLHMELELSSPGTIPADNDQPESQKGNRIINSNDENSTYSSQNDDLNKSLHCQLNNGSELSATSALSSASYWYACMNLSRMIEPCPTMFFLQL